MCTSAGYGAAALVAYVGIVFGGLTAATANFAIQAESLSGSLRHDGSPDKDGLASAAATLGFGMMIMVGSIIFYAMYVIINLSLLCKGQSIGKWCLGTHVVNKRDGTPVSCCANLIRALMVTSLWPYLAIHLLCCGRPDNNQHFVDVCFDTEVVHKVRHSHQH